MHTHDKKNNTAKQPHEKPLIFSIIINIIITAAEITGGVLSGSLALLSDAFHNLSDVVSLIISYFAILIGKKPGNRVKTYGYKRAEIIAALINILALFVICGFIIFEAVKRLKNPEPINVPLMISIASIGLIGNGVSVLLLIKSSKSSLNIKSAFLHLLADTISSVAVIITAIILLFKPWYILDTVLSVLIALYIVKESFSVLMESLNILMQGAPRGIDREKLKKRLFEIKEVNIKGIHHIHMWNITPGETVFDAHV
ncbi:MAG TPA: cation diffusion facilitator family transporter, partial [Spirochaetota bacterium]|nr:cation diffusion facilitator family transporter [Spirochaetota bacterium]